VSAPLSLTLRAESPALPGLFEDVARLLSDQLIDADAVGQAIREKVVVEGANLQRLLQEWVISLLNLARVQKMIFRQCRVVSLKTPDQGPCTLVAEAEGELIDSHRHHLKQNLEALLCREVRLNQDSLAYHAEVTLGD